MVGRLGDATEFNPVNNQEAWRKFKAGFGAGCRSRPRLGIHAITRVRSLSVLRAQAGFASVVRAVLLDPAKARWTSEDPLGLKEGPNHYAYVANNPLNTVDPDGRAAAGAAVVIGVCTAATAGACGAAAAAATIVTAAAIVAYLYLTQENCNEKELKLGSRTAMRSTLRTPRGVGARSLMISCTIDA
jgi:uncharacterized protein RhaS with RHS repeats